MVLNNYGEVFEHKGRKFTVGEVIFCTKESDYEGLVGLLMEIRTGDEKETDNKTLDLYCSLKMPDLTENRARERLQKLSGNGAEEPNLDQVIMAPDMILMSEEFYRQRKTKPVFLLIEDWAFRDNYGFTTEVFTTLEDAQHAFEMKLRYEDSYGVLSYLFGETDTVLENAEDSYVGYTDGRYCESHYSLCIEKKDMYFPFDSAGEQSDKEINRQKLGRI